MTNARISACLNRARLARGHAVRLQGHIDRAADADLVAIEIALEGIIGLLKAERAAQDIAAETGAPLMLSGGGD
jgi:hypothetical protein